MASLFGITGGDVLGKVCPVPGEFTFTVGPAVVSITRASTVATVTMASAHGLAVGRSVTINGCVQAEYNGTFDVVSTPTTTTFTVTVGGSPATPATGSPRLWDLTEAECLAIVETQEARLLASLPERYRILMSRVEGEVACADAEAGQSTVTAGLVPITSGTMKVYVNFTDGKAWSERSWRDELESTEWSVALDTGVVTFDPPLNDGDVVWLEYAHGAAGTFAWLRECVLNMAAAEVSRRFSYFRDQDGWRRFESWEAQAKETIEMMSTGQRPGVEELERMALVNETRPMSLRGILG